MADKKMLIDASYPEETRVVVVDQSRLTEYDVEVASRRQLKGNIYLAKITRVEPSLQAAFVDYGGDRHGFLAFNEIHPDYYQIPIADRRALLADEQAADLEGEQGKPENESDQESDAVDEDEELVPRPARLSPRRYKIQEVIKRRQIMLVQVAKEQRGNKGAALTTYLSLAGRCCVLMPNTARGGGISRKITNASDRSRLKKILAELEVPEGMAVIVRTAGAGRNKSEVKRDYEYLLRLWSSIREETLKSMAPKLVYEEGSLIKRSIRDLYGRDIEEIIVQGENEYRIAKEFMKLFTPSHARRVKAYNDAEVPLFQRYQVESQLEEMHRPDMQLKSGGSIVINPTEALVAIDVNSGRATRERHIEETALRTNLEAAEEIARQLRLRDLAGLVVIDFIDMENHRNRGFVERRLRESMKSDRARIQLGHISAFGLLELSRQRLRPSLLETSFETCQHCRGTGVRPTTESSALTMLRRIEEEGLSHRYGRIKISIPTPVAMYLLNEKRQALSALEAQYGFEVVIMCDDSLVFPDYSIERIKISSVPPEDSVTEEETTEADSREAERGNGGNGVEPEREESGKRGRRRRPRRRKVPEGEAVLAEDADAETESSEEPADDQPVESDEEIELGAEQGSEPSTKRRRRGKRGGRRRSRKPSGSEDEATVVGEGFQGELRVDAATSEVPESETVPITSSEVDTGMEVEKESRSGPQADSAGASDDEPQPRPADRREMTRMSEADREIFEGLQAVEREIARRVDGRSVAEREPQLPKGKVDIEFVATATGEEERRLVPHESSAKQAQSPSIARPRPDEGDQDRDANAEPSLNRNEENKEVDAPDERPVETAESEQVIRVGREQHDEAPTSPRKGWWQRFLE